MPSSEEPVISPQGCSAIGVVRASDIDGLDVELAAPPRCQGCDGACLWYRAPNSERLKFEPNAAIPVGATVTVTLPGRYLLLGAALVYGVPLAALLAGAVFGSTLGRSDLAAAAGAALALSVALLVAPILRRTLERATLRRLAVRRVA